MSDYSEQDRGDAEAYERYLSGMDGSMRHKVALTAAHLLAEGTVADMGMGSGTGTLALASLYPRMKVVGVDVNPEMVQRASAKYVLPNLSFIAGDIAANVFASASLTGIFNSSVLHHVTSFSGYDHEAAARALAVQSTELAVGGSLIVRDFIAPEPQTVLLDLPATDGDDGDDPETCSSARLFERFAREFRAHSAQPGFDYAPVVEASDLTDGWRRYRLEHRHAVEFLLRKDYRSDYGSEVLEEYTYFTQRRFEREFTRLGLRLLASFPIRNPWIVKHRFVGRCALRTSSGTPIDFPATNILIVGEKVAMGEGVRFEAGAQCESIGFLEVHGFRHKESGALRDLVRRPGTRVDIVPWFEDRGALYVLARKGHPRPILQTNDADAALDGGSSVGYVTEPIWAVQTDRPIGLTVDEALERAAGIGPNGILRFVESGRYYPSPGGLIEEVRAVHVEIAPIYVERAVHNATGFSSAGSVRAIDARQLLRAAQVGALPDARLELNVYELLLGRGDDPGPWIGEELSVPESGHGEALPSAQLELPRRRSFVPNHDGAHAGFLARRCRLFQEVGADGKALARHPREYVLPLHRSTNTIACGLIRRCSGRVLFALDEDDLPAAQCFEGSSALWVTPAWRLPREVSTRASALVWMRERLRHEYGIDAEETWELGGRYYPSAGTTPEIVFPFAVSAKLGRGGERPLRWVALDEIVRQIHRFRDGHLRVTALRAAHALGLLAARQA